MTEKKIPTKEELKQQVMATKLMDEATFEQLYSEFRKEAEDIFDNIKEGKTEEEAKKEFNVDDNVARRFVQRIGRLRRSPAKSFTGFVFGKATTDFISKKERTAAISLFNENPDMAIEKGLTNEEGEPLYTKGEGRIGQVMPVHSYAMNLLLFVKKEIEEGQYEDKYKLAHLTLKTDVYEDTANPYISMNVPLFTPVSFKANVSDKNSTDDYYTLNQSVLTKFSIVEDKEVDFSKFALTLRKNKSTGQADLANSNFIKMNELQDWVDLHKGEKRFIKNFVIMEGAASVSERAITLSDNSTYDIAGDFESVTIWMDKSGLTKVDFEDSADILAICTARSWINKDGKEQIATESLGFWTEAHWKKKVTPKPVEENVTEEVVIEENVEW